MTADNAGNTPLHYASKSGMTEMVKMLVGQGAAVEKRNRSGQTAYDVATDHVIRQFLLPLQLKVQFFFRLWLPILYQLLLPTPYRHKS